MTAAALDVDPVVGTKVGDAGGVEGDHCCPDVLIMFPNQSAYFCM
jgi:hypothetical protein